MEAHCLRCQPGPNHIAHSRHTRQVLSPDYRVRRGPGALVLAAWKSCLRTQRGSIASSLSTAEERTSRRPYRHNPISESLGVRSDLFLTEVGTAAGQMRHTGYFAVPRSVGREGIGNPKAADWRRFARNLPGMSATAPRFLPHLSTEKGQCA